MSEDKTQVSYSLKELFDKIDSKFDKMDSKFDKIDNKFDKIDSKFNWLIGLMIACFFGVAALIFNLSNKMDKVIERVHDNDKRITVLETKN